MSIVLELPADLEAKFAAAAAREGISLSDYLLRILANGGPATRTVSSGAELVEYWKQAGIVGSWSGVSDSQEHARKLRAEAERRERP
jgi:hypothetical protein